MSRMEDQASDLEMAERETAIVRARQAADHGHDGVSAMVCGCGADIPQERRDALPGVRKCIDCARASELIKRRYRD